MNEAKSLLFAAPRCSRITMNSSRGTRYQVPAATRISRSSRGAHPGGAGLEFVSMPQDLLRQPARRRRRTRWTC